MTEKNSDDKINNWKQWHSTPVFRNLSLNMYLFSIWTDERVPM